MPDTWTTRRLLAWTAGHFERLGLDSPRLSAEMLLAHVLGVERLRLFMDADRPASDLERAAFRDLVERASKHEPVDYLVGRAPFFSMMLQVTPAVLIPRPSTETLVEHVLQHTRAAPGYRDPVLADVGTGSGAIAVAVAKNLPGARITATDIRGDALQVARRNAQTQGVADRIDFLEGDLFEPLKGFRGRYLCANPPYIPDHEWDAVAANVKDHEPHGALRGGADGLRFVRPLIEGAGDYLDTPGQLVLEIASVTAPTCIALATAAGLKEAHVLADHEALPRVLVAEKR